MLNSTRQAHRLMPRGQGRVSHLLETQIRPVNQPNKQASSQVHRSRAGVTTVTTVMKISNDKRYRERLLLTSSNFR